MTFDKDQKILFGVLPIALLALTTSRVLEMEQREFALSVLFGISWLYLVTRYYYVSLDTPMILLAILWLLGFLAFYAAVWISAPAIEVLRNMSRFTVVGILAYIFFDYIRLNTQLSRKGVVAGAFISITLCLLFFNVFGYRIPYEPLDSLLQAAIILSTLMVAMLYWSFLAQKKVRWPWTRGRSENRRG